MARTTIDVDQEALARARVELGTTGLSATVNAALRHVARESTLRAFDVRRDVDGTPEQVQANRQDRHPG